MSSFFGISLVQLILGVAVFILVTVTIFSCVNDWDNHNVEQKALQTQEAIVLNAKLLLSEAQQAKTTFPVGSDDFQYRRLSFVVPDDYFVMVFAGTQETYTIPECNGQACICLFEDPDDELLLPRDPNNMDYRKKLVKCDLLDYGFPVHMSPTHYTLNKWSGKVNQYVPIWAWGNTFSQSFWLVAHRSTKQAVFNGVNTNEFHVNLVLFTEEEMSSLGNPQLHPIDQYGPKTLCDVDLKIECGKEGVVFSMQDAVPPLAGQTIKANKCFGVACSAGNICYLSYNNPEVDSKGDLQKYGKGTCIGDGAEINLDNLLGGTSTMPIYYRTSNHPITGQSGIKLKLDATDTCGVGPVTNGEIVSGISCTDPLEFCVLRDHKLSMGQSYATYTIDAHCLTSPS